MKISTLEQQQKIQKFIQTELLKRGFLAPITKFEEEETRRSGSRFIFETSNFQTTPVIFEKIIVTNFSSSISEPKIHEKSGAEYFKFWISVHVSYEHFGGGSNGCSLFSVGGELCKGEVYGLKCK